MLLILPLVYPLKLGEEIIRTLATAFENTGPAWKLIWDWQLEPYLYFGLSPLILKWAFAGVLTLMLIAAYVVMKIMDNRPSGRFRLSPPFVLLYLLLFYAILSALFISPTIHKSTQAAATFILAVIFFIIVSDCRKSPSFAGKALVLTGIGSFLLCVISLMQHLQLTSAFMLKFDRVRNSMGSFIGHNTGLSSYIMTSIFFSIAVFSSVSRKSVRLILGIFLGLMAFIIIAAQSRGVIAILVFLMPLFLFYLARNTGWRIPWKSLVISLIVIVIIITAQMIPHRMNPFYNHEMPLVKRLEAFNPKALKGTRLRILTVSMDLIRESPVLGYGLNSFQYVYPKAQGEYYAAHPDTLLAPTDLRTQRAHNEYLQVLIELGFSGLIVILAILYLFLKKGQAVMEKAGNRHIRSLLCAMFFSITAILLHCFMDFPMQIPPICILFLFLMALWTSGNEIWMPGPAPFNEDAPRHRATPLFQVARILLIIALPGLLPLGTAFILRPYRSDMIYYKSDMFIQTFQQYPDITLQQKQNLLRDAAAVAQMGLRQDPLHAELQYKLADASYMTGALYGDMWKKVLREGRIQDAESFKLASIQNIKRAIYWFNSALGEYRFHAVYFMIATCENALDRMSPGGEHRAKARENYALAVRYSPAFAMAANDYAEFLLRISQELPEGQRNRYNNEIFELRKLILKYRPDYFETQYVNKALKTMENGETDKAIGLLVDIVRVDRDNPLYYACLATALTDQGRFDAADEILNQAEIIQKDHPDIADARAILHVRRGKHDLALAAIRERLAFKKSNDPIFEVLEALILREMGRSAEAGEKMERIESLSRENPDYLQALGMINLDYFDRQDEGIDYLRRRVRISDPPPVAQVFYRLGLYENNRGDRDAALGYLKRALEILPDYKPARELRDSIINEVAHEKN